ncbi:MAG: hypothetical protein WC958_02995 [Dehalococcoidales bacterium]
MDLVTKIVLIIATVLIIGGTCFVLIFYRDDIFGPRFITTTTTEVSTPTQSGEAEYAVAVTALDSEVVDAILSLNSLMSNPQISSQAWSDSVSKVHGKVAQLHSNATLMKVPDAAAAQLQTYYINNVTRNLVQAIQWIASAIEQGKGELLNNAIAHMEAVGPARANFINELNNYIVNSTN